MNVYSVRFLPNFKIKLCEFLGIASEMAIQQLRDRVARLETKISRLDQAIHKANHKTTVTKRVKQKPTAQVQRKKNPQNPQSPKQELRMVNETVRPNVVLIRADEELRGMAQSYFSEAAHVAEFDEVPAVTGLPSGEITAVFFDRSLLGDEASRQKISELSALLDRTRFVGLSSYLTLAFAESIPQNDSFATWLTRPLKKESLDAIFVPEQTRAIS